MAFHKPVKLCLFAELVVAVVVSPGVLVLAFLPGMAVRTAVGVASGVVAHVSSDVCVGSDEP